MKISSRVRFGLIPVVIAWGVFPFGAVHPWAFWPLVGLLLLVAVSHFGAAPATPSLFGVTVAALVLGPTGLQLLPLSASTFQSIAPAQYELVTKLDPLMLLGVNQSHPLSVAPYRTMLTLVSLASGVIWTAAIAKALTSALRPTVLVRQVMGIALVVAVFALVQKATFNGKIYWVWESAFGVSNNYFGPFVNRNHFAGWMLLASALGVGYLIGQMRRAMPNAKSWRARLLWFSTRQAGRVTITAAVVTTMAVSLVWALSRSGIIAFTTTMVMLAAAAAVRIPGRARRWAVALSILAVMLVVASWRGIESISSKYADTSTLQWRFDLWRHSLPAVRDFFPLGAGMNGYGTVMLFYPQTDLTVHAQQTHNDYLQLAIEGSLLVGLPLAVAFAMMMRRAWTQFHQPQEDTTWWIRMGAVAGIAGMAVQELTEFSLQIPGVAALFCVLIAIAIHKAPAPSQRPVSRHEHA